MDPIFPCADSHPFFLHYYSLPTLFFIFFFFLLSSFFSFCPHLLLRLPVNPNTAQESLEELPQQGRQPKVIHLLPITYTAHVFHLTCLLGHKSDSQNDLPTQHLHYCRYRLQHHPSSFSTSSFFLPLLLFHCQALLLLVSWLDTMSNHVYSISVLDTGATQGCQAQGLVCAS